MKKSVICAILLAALIIGCSNRGPDVKFLDNFTAKHMTADGLVPGYEVLVWGGANKSIAVLSLEPVEPVEGMGEAGRKQNNYLRLDWTPSYYHKDYFVPFVALKPFAILGDWSGYSTFNIDLRKQGINTTLILNLFDCKNDIKEKWSRGFPLTSESEDFFTISVPLEEEGWHLIEDQELNDGRLDFSSLCLMEIIFKAHGANETNSYYFRDFYLAR
jgi:hypothetical protein